MPNPFENIMQQAQKAQENMKQAQEELAEIRITGESGAGMVKLTVNGNGEALDIDIDDDIYKENKKVLQGLIVAAINDAKIKRGRVKQEKLKALMGGFGLPANMNFPFMSD